MTDQKPFCLDIAREDHPTADGRSFELGILDWPELENAPLPLMYLDTKTTEGHTGAQVAGFIHNIWRENGVIKGDGFFAPGEHGDYLAEQVDAGFGGVSVDLVNTDYVEMPDEFGELVKYFTKGTIRGATVLPVPAFDDTRISVVASAIPMLPPKEWFDDPKLSEPTMLTITADGRIYGHVAAWDSCHVGFFNKCVKPPRSRSGYKHFNNRPVITQDGEEVLAGPLTFGVGHASLQASAKAAAAHYDNVDAQIGQIRTGEDEFGVWMAGALNPDVDELKLRKLRASAVSGDWRASELYGVLCVNLPGFPVPRAKAQYKQDKQFALVAAGVVIYDDELIPEGENTEMSEKKNATEHPASEQEEVTLDGAVAEFGASLQTIVDKDPESEVSIKAAELLNFLTENVPETTEAQPVQENAITREEFDALSMAVAKIGTIMVKKF